MGGIFNLDSKFMRALSKLADLMWVNILTLVCCIPIFTIGASFTAMHTVVYKLYKNEEGYITREFFKAFKSNFKQSTLMWLIYLVLGLVLCGDIWLFYRGLVDLGNIVRIIVYVALVVYLFSLSWLFVLQSRYENPIKYTMRNTIVVSMTHVMYSLMMIILFLSPVVLLLLFSWAVPVCFLLGFSVPAYVQAILYSRIFDKIENPETGKENPDDWVLEENPDGKETDASGSAGSDFTDVKEEQALSEALTVGNQADITAQKPEVNESAE